jgi:hypothetical protein
LAIDELVRYSTRELRSNALGGRHTEFAHEVAKQDPAPLRQAKYASDITMDIMGRHYVTSRMEELLDVMPPMNLKLPDDE